MELDFKGVPNECVWGDGGGGLEYAKVWCVLMLAMCNTFEMTPLLRSSLNDIC